MQLIVSLPLILKFINILNRIEIIQDNKTPIY